MIHIINDKDKEADPKAAEESQMDLDAVYTSELSQGGVPGMPPQNQLNEINQKIFMNYVKQKQIMP